MTMEGVLNQFRTLRQSQQSKWIHSWKSTFRNASENDKNDGISAFQVKRNIVRRINGNVSLTVINFLKILNIDHIINHGFQLHHVFKWAFSYQQTARM